MRYSGEEMSVIAFDFFVNIFRPVPITITGTRPSADSIMNSCPVISHFEYFKKLFTNSIGITSAFPTTSYSTNFPASNTRAHLLLYIFSNIFAHSCGLFFSIASFILQSIPLTPLNHTSKTPPITHTIPSFRRTIFLAAWNCASVSSKGSGQSISDSFTIPALSCIAHFTYG